MKIIFLLILSSLATDIAGKEVISDLKSIEGEKIDWRQKKSIALKPATTKRISGNIPNIDRSSANSESQVERSPVIRPNPKVRSYNIPVNIGDLYECRIYQDIIGYVGSVSPVRAEIIEGPLKGHIFIGNATMDPKTKNILVEFHKIRSQDGRSIVNTTATVHSSSGALGLEGSTSSHYWRYFFASVLSAAAQGYSEATVQRQRDFFGQFQNTPTTDSAGKIGVAEGFSQTADLMAENMKSAPEFTTVKGPIRTKVFIIDDMKI